MNLSKNSNIEEEKFSSKKLCRRKTISSFPIYYTKDNISFCTCKKSKSFPFCDGTHKILNKQKNLNFQPITINFKKLQQQNHNIFIQNDNNFLVIFFILCKIIILCIIEK